MCIIKHNEKSGKIIIYIEFTKNGIEKIVSNNICKIYNN